MENESFVIRERRDLWDQILNLNKKYRDKRMMYFNWKYLYMYSRIVANLVTISTSRISSWFLNTVWLWEKPLGNWLFHSVGLILPRASLQSRDCRSKSPEANLKSPLARDGTSWALISVCAPSPFSRVRLFETWWTVARLSPLSMGFSRQEYWSGLPCPLPGDLPDPGIKPVPLVSPTVAGGFFTTSATGEAHQ